MHASSGRRSAFGSDSHERKAASGSDKALMTPSDWTDDVICQKTHMFSLKGKFIHLISEPFMAAADYQRLVEVVKPTT